MTSISFGMYNIYPKLNLVYIILALYEYLFSIVCKYKYIKEFVFCTYNMILNPRITMNILLFDILFSYF